MTLVRSLELMAEVYRLDGAGGADSSRFRRYVGLAASHPIHTYNPMTGRPEALETVGALLDAGAETTVEELCEGRTISLSVMTPGARTETGPSQRSTCVSRGTRSSGSGRVSRSTGRWSSHGPGRK